MDRKTIGESWSLRSASDDNSAAVSIITKVVWVVQLSSFVRQKLCDRAANLIVHGGVVCVWASETSLKSRSSYARQTAGKNAHRSLTIISDDKVTAIPTQRRHSAERRLHTKRTDSADRRWNERIFHVLNSVDMVLVQRVCVVRAWALLGPTGIGASVYNLNSLGLWYDGWTNRLCLWQIIQHKTVFKKKYKSSERVWWQQHVAC